MGGGLIVPVGGHDAAAVLDSAAALAHDLRAEVTLVHVEADPFATPMTPSEEEVLADWNHAQDVLDELVVRLRGRGVCASAVVRQGVVETEVLAVASKRADALLVVASRPRRRPRWLGTTDEARELVRHSPVPVLLVNPERPPLHGLRAILAPYELPADPSLAAARALARDARARVIPLHVEASDGPVASSITRVAGEVGADVIVLSTRPRDHPRGTWLGGVVEGVVASARQPVVLVR